MRRSVRVVGGHAALAAAARRRFHAQSVQNVLREVRARLVAVGREASDAKALVAHALEPKLAASNDLFLCMDRTLRREEADTLVSMVQRRERGEPLAYILGVKEFWSLPLRVSTDTLIPRADSEVLVETLTTQYPKDAVLRILDLGTGGGALLLAALSEYPRATGVGIDISAGALRVARGNAERLGFGGRATFLELDMEKLPHLRAESASEASGRKADSTDATLFQRFDVILCNPPYIPLCEVPLVAPDVLAHEPHGALFSDGPDAWTRKLATPTIHGENGTDNDDGSDLGLRFYVALRESVDKLLDPASSVPRTVLIEIGSERQAHAVGELFVGASCVSFDRFLMDGSRRHRGLLLKSSSR